MQPHSQRKSVKEQGLNRGRRPHSIVAIGIEPVHTSDSIFECLELGWRQGRQRSVAAYAQSIRQELLIAYRVVFKCGSILTYRIVDVPIDITPSVQKRVHCLTACPSHREHREPAGCPELPVTGCKWP